ncbi:response regulator [Paraburkholderia domus]|uniref:response regulator n=1 Tax=Paraburkholderia domus TaxID=2793075 RepID=UPI001EF147C1|nr:hypothetical protein [Paraburkholderia domus]
MYAVFFCNQGFDVRTAADGADALTEYCAWYPAAVLLDIEMPRLDGREVARAIRLVRTAPGTRASSSERPHVAIRTRRIDARRIRSPFREAGSDADHPRCYKPRACSELNTNHVSVVSDPVLETQPDSIVRRAGASVSVCCNPCAATRNRGRAGFII